MNYQYDLNGNMLQSGKSTIEYNAMNKPIHIRDGKEDIYFSYDMNGNRYKKEDKNKTTYYIGKEYELIIKKNGEREVKNLIYADGKVVAIHTEGYEFIETRYLHYDALGSVDTITDQRGAVVQRLAYKPFGEQIDVIKKENSITNRGYTGHEHIEGTHLIHMNARIYDSSIGRFLSADTIIQDPYDTQSYNRYSYVRNNPLKYTDPTGHLFSGIGHWFSHNWQTVVTVVVVAVVTYYTGGLATDVAYSAFIQGASAGFAGGFTATALNGGSFGNAMVNGVIGGIMGGVTAGFAYNIGTMGQNIGGYSGYGARVAMHGALGSFMSRARGGRWSSGFWSGSVGTLFGPLTRTSSYYFNVASNAVVSGTVSRITGGKFANGAVFGAFRYMFNDALKHGKKIIWMKAKDMNEATLQRIMFDRLNLQQMDKDTFEKVISGWKFKNTRDFGHPSPPPKTS